METTGQMETPKHETSTPSHPLVTTPSTPRRDLFRLKSRVTASVHGLLWNSRCSAVLQVMLDGRQEHQACFGVKVCMYMLMLYN
jgi:hypothetical protein